MATKILLTMPGIMGNTLWAANIAGGPLYEIWHSTTATALGFFRFLEMNAQGTGPFNSWFPEIVPSTGISGFYGPWCDHYRSQGWSVVDALIDWRRKIQDNVLPVVQQVERLGRYGPVTILAHSRGGNVAVDVCKALQQRSTLHYVKRVVTLGTPYGGSYVPVGCLGGWDQLYLFMKVFLANTSALNWRSMGLKPEVVVNSWPGVYELLPDPAKAAANGDQIASSLYHEPNWAISGITVSAAHLASALARWATNPAPPAGMDWTAFAGGAQETLGPLVSPTTLDDGYCCEGRLNGDEVVPRWSAQCPGYTTIVLPTTHKGFISDPGNWPTIDVVLNAP